MFYPPARKSCCAAYFPTAATDLSIVYLKAVQLIRAEEFLVAGAAHIPFSHGCAVVDGREITFMHVAVADNGIVVRHRNFLRGNRLIVLVRERDAGEEKRCTGDESKKC